jgi:hypothetical protein
MMIVTKKFWWRPIAPPAIATVLLAIAVLLGASTVHAATYTVTSTQCEGAGSITEAMTLANNNPGEDTITFSPAGLQIEAAQCLPAFEGFSFDYYIVNPTESVVFEGNGAKLAGNIVWITSGGLDTPIGPISGCWGDNDLLFATTPGFVKVGTPGQDNSAITVTVRDLEMFELNSVARIEKNASLILEDVNLNRIIAGFRNCTDVAVLANEGANFTARRTVWDEIWNGSDLFLLGTNPAIAGLPAPEDNNTIFPSAGNLTIEDSIFKNVYKGTVRWDGQTGATVNIVTSRFDVAGGIIVQGDAESNIVNSILSSSVSGAVGLAERLANLSSQDMNIKASTVLFPSVECDSACRDVGEVGLIFTQGVPGQGKINFIQSAIGVNFPDTLPTPSTRLLDLISYFTADAFTWIQPTALQDAAALKTRTNQPNLLTDPPALPTEGLFTLAEWATPLVPGELVDRIADAVCDDAIPANDGANALRNPIDNSCITEDALGNPRVDGNNSRNIGAVQVNEAPHLAVAGAGDGTVDLSWTKPRDLDGLCGYRVTYREKGTTNDMTIDILDPDTLSYQVTGLMNAIEYEFEVEGLVNCATTPALSGFPSNLVTATPITNVARVNPYLTITVSGQSTDTTPVPDGPAGVFSFTSTYCNKAGSPTLKSLVSLTSVLTNGNSLINRDRDGTGTPAGGVGSELDFPLDPEYDDGLLAAGECVDVPYEIGLTKRARFKFNVVVLGSEMIAP